MSESQTTFFYCYTGTARSPRSRFRSFRSCVPTCGRRCTSLWSWTSARYGVCLVCICILKGRARMLCTSIKPLCKVCHGSAQHTSTFLFRRLHFCLSLFSMIRSTLRFALTCCALPFTALRVAVNGSAQHKHKFDGVFPSFVILILQLIVASCD